MRGFGKTECAEGGMVFDKFDPGLECEGWTARRRGAAFSQVDIAGGEVPTPVAGGDGEFADMRRLRRWRQENAGDGGLAEDPDLDHAPRGQPVHR